LQGISDYRHLDFWSVTASASEVMQIAWCAAVDEPAVKMSAAELNAARDQVAITSAHVVADPSGGVLGRRIQSD
jgi:hypothetical protein